MPDNGVWVAYYSDWSGFAVFTDELQAFRYAVAGTMQVAFVHFGKDIQEQVRDG